MELELQSIPTDSLKIGFLTTEQELSAETSSRQHTKKNNFNFCHFYFFYVKLKKRKNQLMLNKSIKKNN